MIYYNIMFKKNGSSSARTEIGTRPGWRILNQTTTITPFYPKQLPLRMDLEKIAT